MNISNSKSLGLVILSALVLIGISIHITKDSPNLRLFSLDDDDVIPPKMFAG